MSEPTTSFTGVTAIKLKINGQEHELPIKVARELRHALNVLFHDHDGEFDSVRLIEGVLMAQRPVHNHTCGKPA